MLHFIYSIHMIYYADIFSEISYLLYYGYFSGDFGTPTAHGAGQVFASKKGTLLFRGWVLIVIRGLAILLCDSNVMQARK